MIGKLLQRQCCGREDEREGVLTTILWIGGREGRCSEDNAVDRRVRGKVF